MQLRNKYDLETLKKRLLAEKFPRITLSFYRYVLLEDVSSLRDDLYLRFDALGVLGRIFIAGEGINAQLSVPEPRFGEFRALIDSYPAFRDVPFKIAVEDNAPSFYKLIVRVRPQIVADGLEDGTFDVTNVGRHLSAREWNAAMRLPGTVVVDMRNYYESEVGHFRGAVLPQCDTFKEELPMVVEELKDKKDQKILLYCTGGIRCEKASAFLRHHGFEDVNQLHGGIIDYARQVRAEGLESQFTGKNFVFDDRMGERITGDVISRCHQCGQPCDTHVNCANDDCHLLFIQCPACAERMNGCCTPQCMSVQSLPAAEQKEQRRGHTVPHKSRLRPRLQDLQQQNNPA
jgi:UPF0176 protein